MAETPRVEYRKGEGPDQLEQGEATALNEAPMPGPPATALEDAFAPGQPVPQYPSSPERRAPPAYRPNGLEEEMLFLDAPEAGTGIPTLPPGRLPSSVLRNLPLMRRAADDPEAPRAVRMIYAALVNSLEGELRR
jgi:hypothetical protein